MKKLIILILVMIPALLFGQEVIVAKKKAGGGGTTYIYSGSGSYPSETVATGYIEGTSVTTTDAITITKLGVNLWSTGTSTECWVQLSRDDGAINYAYGTFSPITGWNDITVSYAASATTTYTIWFSCNGTWSYANNTGTPDLEEWIGPVSYSTPPIDVSTHTGGVGHPGARIGY